MPRPRSTSSSPTKVEDRTLAPRMDVRDPLQAERWEATDREGYLRRREFLQRTAMTAGLAASAGLVLGPEALIAQAARAQRRSPLPSPKNLPIDRFVVLM